MLIIFLPVVANFELEIDSVANESTVFGKLSEAFRKFWPILKFEKLLVVSVHFYQTLIGYCVPAERTVVNFGS